MSLLENYRPVVGLIMISILWVLCSSPGNKAAGALS